MKQYLLRRFTMLLLVLLGVSILSFALIGLFGRDPAEVIARRTNINATYEQIEAVRVSIMGYLSYWFQGVDMAIRSGEIEAAAKEAGFSGTETRTELLCSGTQDIVILRK